LNARACEWSSLGKPGTLLTESGVIRPPTDPLKKIDVPPRTDSMRARTPPG
jgi:hypothetical protein